MKVKHWLCGMALVPMILLAGWAFWWEPNQLHVREVELELPHWVSAPDNLRVALLADLHLGSPINGLPRLRRIVRAINQANPDLILFLGDLVPAELGAMRSPPEGYAKELALLRAPYGVFGVLGNHDRWWDASRITETLQYGGMILLEDHTMRLQIRGRAFWLAGVSDRWESPLDVGMVLAGIPEGDSILLMTHNPDLFPGVPKRVALTVAGHTHGGQVDLPFFGRTWVPSNYGQRYAAGHIVENGRHLFVTVGTGTSILPVRFRVPPEVVILTLHSTPRP